MISTRSIRRKKHHRKKRSRQGKSSRFSARASVIAIGQWVRQFKWFDIIKQQVSIPQKVVKHSPVEKVLDAFISILAGAKGLCEVNKRVRPDKMLPLAFGRLKCAEQSPISQTLNAVRKENITPMSHTFQTLYRQHGPGFRHDYDKGPQILGVDFSGMPCGKKAELA